MQEQMHSILLLQKHLNFKLAKWNAKKETRSDSQKIGHVFGSADALAWRKGKGSPRNRNRGPFEFSKMPLIATVPLTILIVGARAGLLTNGQNTVCNDMITYLIPRNKVGIGNGKSQRN